MTMSNLMTVEMVRTTCPPTRRPGRPPARTRRAARAWLGGPGGLAQPARAAGSPRCRRCRPQCGATPPGPPAPHPASSRPDRGRGLARTTSRSAGLLRHSGRPGTPARDDAIAHEAVGTYRVTDHSVGPYCEAPARGEKRPRLAVGQCDGHHDVHPGPQRDLLIPGDHCREVLVVRGLDEATGPYRGRARRIREPSHKTLLCRRIGRDLSPEPVLPHCGRPSRPADARPGPLKQCRRGQCR